MKKFILSIIVLFFAASAFAQQDEPAPIEKYEYKYDFSDDRRPEYFIPEELRSNPDVSDQTSEQRAARIAQLRQEIESQETQIKQNQEETKKDLERIELKLDCSNLLQKIRDNIQLIVNNNGDAQQLEVDSQEYRLRCKNAWADSPSINYEELLNNELAVLEKAKQK